MVKDFDSIKTIILFEYPVAYRATKKKYRCSGSFDYRSVFLNHLHSCILSTSYQHRPSAADTAISIHKSIIFSSNIKDRDHRFLYGWSQMCHTSGKIEYSMRLFRDVHFFIYDRIIVLQFILSCRALSYSEFVTLNTYLAYYRTFSTKQTLVADFFNTPFVVSLQLSVQIHSCIFGVCRNGAEWTSIDTDSAHS